ncbi:ArsR family transcriptional regulator [Candidatus Woesearchaeota archaeon]|nr:ArsR family transcriptional regulator [Candidatus Woesearchaeota archaeon]
MEKSLKQFNIKKLKESTEKDTDKDIEWICGSLGFITPRDQDKTAYIILKALIKSAKEKKGKTSEELGKLVEPTRGSVIYHLKRLMKSGLVVKMGSAYELKMNCLANTIQEIRKEVDITLDDIQKVAKDIDGAVGLETR